MIGAIVAALIIFYAIPLIAPAAWSGVKGGAFAIAVMFGLYAVATALPANALMIVWIALGIVALTAFAAMWAWLLYRTFRRWYYSIVKALA